MDLQKKKQRWVAKYRQLTEPSVLRAACNYDGDRRRVIKYYIDGHSLVLEADDSWYSKLSRLTKNLTSYQVQDPEGVGFFGPAILVLIYERDSASLDKAVEAIASGKLRYDTATFDKSFDPHGRGHH